MRCRFTSKPNALSHGLIRKGQKLVGFLFAACNSAGNATVTLTGSMKTFENTLENQTQRFIQHRNGELVNTLCMTRVRNHSNSNWYWYLEFSNQGHLFSVLYCFCNNKKVLEAAGLTVFTLSITQPGYLDWNVETNGIPAEDWTT